MKLYAIPHSPYAARVVAQIRLRSLPVEIVDRRGMDNEVFRNISHTGKVPALDTGDGVIVESLAIVEYLEDAFADNTLFPRDAVARARLRALFYGCDNYLSTQLFPLFQRLQGGMNRDGVDKDLQSLRTALADMELFWHEADPGEDIGLADCVLAPVMFYINVLAPMFGDNAIFDATPLLAARWQQMQTDTVMAVVLEEMDAGLKAMMGG